jgi:hypothetical protein
MQAIDIQRNFSVPFMNMMMHASSIFDKWFYPKHRSFYAVFIQRYILQTQNKHTNTL